MPEQPSTHQSPRQAVAAWLAGAAAQGQPDSYYGKRKALRYIWPAALEVRLEPPAQPQRPIYVTGQDLSPDGIGLFGRHKLQVGARIWLRYADDGDAGPWVPAVVAHSTLSVGGYRVGVRFDLG